jgi:hypothetical protein
MVILDSNPYTSSRMGFESLKVGLSFPVNVVGSKSFNTDALSMVPYPRFSPRCEINVTNPKILVFNG